VTRFAYQDQILEFVASAVYDGNHMVNLDASAFAAVQHRPAYAAVALVDLATDLGEPSRPGSPA
jgi:hypothetical protein